MPARPGGTQIGMLYWKLPLWVTWRLPWNVSGIFPPVFSVETIDPFCRTRSESIRVANSSELSGGPSCPHEIQQATTAPRRPTNPIERERIIFPPPRFHDFDLR